MKYSLTLFFADKKLNNMMCNVDLKPDCKEFITDSRDVVIETTSALDEASIRKIIEASKNDPDFWIPAIGFAGILYVDDDIKILSDGKTEMFIRK